jgi:hypothetical protein
MAFLSIAARNGPAAGARRRPRLTPSNMWRPGVHLGCAFLPPASWIAGNAACLRCLASGFTEYPSAVHSQTLPIMVVSAVPVRRECSHGRRNSHLLQGSRAQIRLARYWPWAFRRVRTHRLSIFRVFELALRSKFDSDSVGSVLPAKWRRRAHPNRRHAPRDDRRILVALWTVGVTPVRPFEERPPRQNDPADEFVSVSGKIYRPCVTPRV